MAAQTEINRPQKPRDTHMRIGLPGLRAARRRWLRLLGFLPIIALVPISFWVEHIYSRDWMGFAGAYDELVYPIASKFINTLFGWVPYSLAEIMLIGGVVTLMGSFIDLIVKLVRKPNRLYRVVRYISILLCIASVGYFMFSSLWAVNYNRPPLAQALGLTVKPRSTQELTALCERLRDDAVQLRGDVPEDERGIFTYSQDYIHTLELVPTAYSRLNTTHEIFQMQYAQPKALLAVAPLMSRMRITGIFIPFTMEANVNTDDVPLLLASTGCHEYAHLFGYAREDEANFLAYMACMAMPDSQFRYSGTVLALITAMSQLNAVDIDAYAQVRAGYSEALVRDLKDYTAFWAQYEGKTAEVANKMNDTYLKAHGQSDGVKSYGRMVDLLLALYDVPAVNEEDNG